MASRRTIEGLARVASRLRTDWGIDVTEMPGWQRTGRGTMTPRGHVNHHTGPGSWSALLTILRFGHAGIGSNSLCTWAVPYDGHGAYLVAAGVSWHAGRGGWRGLSGNASVSATEAQNTGTQPWTSRSLYVQRAINVEMAREFGFSADMICDHKEWAPGRKWDRGGMDPATWRQQVRASLAAGPPAPEPAPKILGGVMIRRVWHPVKQEERLVEFFAREWAWPIPQKAAEYIREAGGLENIPRIGLKEANVLGDQGFRYGGRLHVGLTVEMQWDRPERAAAWDRKVPA